MTDCVTLNLMYCILSAELIEIGIWSCSVDLVLFLLYRRCIIYWSR